MSAGRILIVDDEPKIRRALRSSLVLQGFEVGDARSGDEALEELRSDRYDLVLLDINMPGESGVEICRIIRSSGEIPIVMLTVRNTEKEKVNALEAGADDYVTKPFGMEELVARIRAHLRRSPAASSMPRRIHLGEVEVDFEARQVIAHGTKMRLTPREFDLMRYLVDHSNQVVRHREILRAVWGPDHGDEIEYVRAFVKQLRKKIEPEPAHPKYLLTEPWVGYRLVYSRNEKPDHREIG
jgi:two-component system KDP operon response regulator KdpE